MIKLFEVFSAQCQGKLQSHYGPLVWIDVAMPEGAAKKPTQTLDRIDLLRRTFETRRQRAAEVERRLVFIENPKTVPRQKFRLNGQSDRDHLLGSVLNFTRSTIEAVKEIGEPAHRRAGLGLIYEFA